MILVTGATGLTGHFVVAELLRRGHAVRVLARQPVAIGGVEVVAGDLGDLASVARAAAGTTGIVHTACTYVDAAIDIAAMTTLVDSWQTGPFVYISSLDVYGLSGSGVITEDTPPGELHNDYSRGKLACERVLDRSGRRDYVSLRAPYIWGPHATAYRRLADRLRDPIVLPGVDEREWRDYRDAWVDVRDFATIIAASLDRPAAGPLNVATGSFAWHDLYVELGRSIVHKPLDAIRDDELPNKHLYAQTWRFSEARLADRLGVIPRRSFETTVRDTMAWADRRGPA
jgi:nucleoside-diphosphate-sugar epimerase